MSADEKQKMPMPDDYVPKKPLTGFIVNFDHKRALESLPDAEVKQVLVRLMDYAENYAKSFDSSLRADVQGLSPFASYTLEMMASAAQRGLDSGRRASWGRSGENGGGRPSKDKT